MSVAGSVGRRLTMASTVRRLQGLDIHPSARPRHWDVTSRRFSSGSSPEQSKNYQRLLINIAAGFGCAAALGGLLSGAGYYVITTVNAGVEERFRKQKEATSAKLDAEKVRREGFQTLAKETHLNAMRRIDDIVTSLWSQFNNLSVRCLEWEAQEGFYRSQVAKAQEVLDRQGVTTSAGVHEELLPKISILQAQINFLTEELAHLKLIAQESAAAQEKNMTNDSTPLSLETASDLKGCSATGTRQNGSPPIQHVEAATSVQKGLSAAETGQDMKSGAPSSGAKGLSAAETGQNMKSGAPSSGAKGTKSQGGGGSASV